MSEAKMPIQKMPGDQTVDKMLIGKMSVAKMFFCYSFMVCLRVSLISHLSSALWQ
jgi:hypothetical protein